MPNSRVVSLRPDKAHDEGQNKSHEPGEADSALGASRITLPPGISRLPPIAEGQSPLDARLATYLTGDRGANPILQLGATEKTNDPLGLLKTPSVNAVASVEPGSLSGQGSPTTPVPVQPGVDIEFRTDEYLDNANSLGGTETMELAVGASQLTISPPANGSNPPSVPVVNDTAVENNGLAASQVADAGNTRLAQAPVTPTAPVSPPVSAVQPQSAPVIPPVAPTAEFLSQTQVPPQPTVPLAGPAAPAAPSGTQPNTTVVDPLAGVTLDNADNITLHLDEVPLRRVLELFSRSHSMNILVAPGVNGVVTANFEGVTIDNAMDAILQLCQLSSRKQGNMLFVYPRDGVPTDELDLQVVELDFASAEELLPTVKSLLSPSGSAFTSAIESSNNLRTKEAIVINDVPARVQRVASYLQQMDVAPRQVVIEAHVMEVELDHNQRHGFNYSHLLGDLRVGVSGLADANPNAAFFAAVDTAKIQSVLQCLRTSGNSKTLASPRLMVVNGQKARIQVGQQLGYKVVTATATTAVEEVRFLEVGVVLEVTPRITRDNRILMRVKPEVSSGEVNPDTLLPQEETRELETDVLLGDGQGVVIGGLIQEDDSGLVRSVPGLERVPLVGKLVSKRENDTKRTEIVVTLLPRVVETPHATEIVQETHHVLGPSEILPMPMRTPSPAQPTR